MKVMLHGEKVPLAGGTSVKKLRTVASLGSPTFTNCGEGVFQSTRRNFLGMLIPEVLR